MYKKAQALCGADLQKEMTETITSTMVRRMTDTLTTEGGFEPIDEITDKWKTKRPIMLENLLKRAPRMTCTMNQAELIWVPTYSAKHTTETMHEETRKRKLESETKIRKMKAAKMRNRTQLQLHFRLLATAERGSKDYLRPSSKALPS